MCRGATLHTLTLLTKFTKNSENSNLTIIHAPSD
jgi:hypothetical protein